MWGLDTRAEALIEPSPKSAPLLGSQKTPNADGVWRMRRLHFTSSQNAQQFQGSCRERHFGSRVLNPEDVKSIQPRKLCTFAKEVGIPG
ncbi:hypothetical protein NQ317_005110 [Molorchus minor]|uniref:Uncharacterized protein n=1 Tax=Molorchus minor TaxID=1323400 RepID=A0ABQ9JWN7_9CUCU|nr:hypothetical protein NQ317_005110 [Molorchus minor]